MQDKKNVNKYVCCSKKMSLYICKPNISFMLTKQEYYKLYEKYHQGHCNKQEIELLESYADDFKLIKDDCNNGDMEHQEHIKSKIRQRVLTHIHGSKIIQIFNHRLLRIATAVIVFLCLGLIVRVQLRNVIYDQNSEHVNISAGINAGGFRAKLLLDDGTEVDLDGMKIGDTIESGSVLGTKTQDGQLTYQTNKKNDIVNYHTVVTPNGGEYQVELPDGSLVWLNAASSIRFPTVFNEQKRKVSITGEVYFQVAKNKAKPFVVEVGKQVITVLGTQFNVNAYDDESSIETALVEGSVAIQVNNEKVTLSPGERAAYDKQTTRVITDRFNQKQILAWQRGEFEFNAENIKSVMRKIRRWYDVDVEYKGEITKNVFTGNISKFEDVKEVLDMLSLTGAVSFEIKGRRIYVLNNTQI